MDPIKVTVDARPVVVKTETPPPAAGATTPSLPVDAKPATPPAAAEEKPKSPDSERFAKLARIEARNRQIQRELKAAEAELEARARKVLDQERLYNEAKTDPARLSDIMGPDWYTRATEAQLNGGKLPPEEIARQALEEARLAREEVKQREEEFRKQQAAAIEAERRQYVDNYAGSLLEFVKGDPATYKALNGLLEEGVDVRETMMQTQLQYFAKTQKVLSEAEVAGMVEQYYRRLAAKIGGLAAVADETAKAPEAPAQPPRASQPSRSAPQGTLHNGLTSAPTVPPSPRPKSAVERALAAMEAAAAARTTNG